jgi:hypothetical protein
MTKVGDDDDDLSCDAECQCCDTDCQLCPFGDVDSSLQDDHHDEIPHLATGHSPSSFCEECLCSQRVMIRGWTRD